MTAVFGDFLRPAGEHITAAVSIRDDRSAEAAFGVIPQFGRLLSTLARYVGYLPVPDEFEAAMAGSLSPEAQTALDARIALRRGTQSLRHAMNSLGDVVIDDSHPAVRHLSAAADFLAAGRDLLQTHFTNGPRGARRDRSYWAQVITSRPVTAALLGELADCALQLGPWAARLLVAGTMERGVPAAILLDLHTASHCTWVAGATVQSAQRNHPPTADACRLLSAIPANFPPPRVAPSGREQVRELCDGVVITAERLRQAALRFAPYARWPPTATSVTWRKDALASAIISHASQVILRTLTERAKQLAAGAAIGTQLHNAADAMSQTWPQWRAITHHWDILSTGIYRGTGTSAVATEFGDLVLRIGRLAYRNEHWTPACGDTSLIRDLADLAPALSDMISVMAAVHTAADAVTRIAIEDREAVYTAATGCQLYMPTRLLPDGCDVPFPYTPALQSRADALLAGYDTALKASTGVTTALDDLAVATKATTSALALARQASTAQAQGRDGQRRTLRFAQSRSTAAGNDVAGGSPRHGQAKNPFLLMRGGGRPGSERTLTK
jgi:hypothetical protein